MSKNSYSVSTKTTDIKTQGNLQSWNVVAPIHPSSVNKLTPETSKTNIALLEAEARLKLYTELSNGFLGEQEQNIEYKNILTHWFLSLTAFEIIVINIIVIYALSSSQAIMETIFNFLNVFIGATFVELLGGLFIIVRYAFNHNSFKLLDKLNEKIGKSPHF